MKVRDNPQDLIDKAFHNEPLFPEGWLIGPIDISPIDGGWCITYKKDDERRARWKFPIADGDLRRLAKTIVYVKGNYGVFPVPSCHVCIKAAGRVERKKSPMVVLDGHGDPV